MCLIDTSLSAVADVLHGVEIEDPYRWLEERARLETGVWIASQQRHCAEYFTEDESLATIRQRVRDYLDVEVVDQVAHVGHRRFYRRRACGDQQASLYVYDCVTREERVLVDPATLGPFASVGIHRIASSSSLLAYELQFGGGDRKSIRFVDVENGFTLPDSIEDGYARGFAFATDGRSIYSCQETQESQEHRIVHRTLGDSRDEVIFRITHESGSRLMLIADNIHLGAIHIHRTDGEDSLNLWVADRSEPTRWHQALVNRRLPHTPILSFGGLFALTYENSPNGRLIELDLKGDEIRTVIPEAKGMTRELLFVGQTIFKSSVRCMSPIVERWSATGEHLGNLDLPNNVSVRLHAAQSETADTIFLTTESVTQRPCILACSVASGEIVTWRESDRSSLSHACSIQRKSFVSKDGTSVPITLIVPKHERSGQPTTLMTSYGGFAVDAAPRFSVLQAVVIELGVTVAIPHIRGGGEFGRPWHEAARGRKRQTAFDDFLGAAEWLHDKGFVSPHRLAIFGGSNGGLLVAAAITQRPELFGLSYASRLCSTWFAMRCSITLSAGGRSTELSMTHRTSKRSMPTLPTTVLQRASIIPP